MHLHGFYFNLSSRGSYLADTTLGAARHLAVTQELHERSTMSIAWSPDRPGNWLFHCHLVFHVIKSARLDAPRMKHEHDEGPMDHMAGLVMGITVRDPNGLARHSSGPARKPRLFANQRPEKSFTGMRMSYVLQRDSLAPAIDSVEPPGRMLVLTRGEPTEITVINRTHAATSVHWHGVELESYFDGVAGWSGADMKVAPMIAPRDSFTARLLLPRAGTFIYHTHLNDVEQLVSGAYGPLIVLERGQEFDAESDFVFTAGQDAARLRSPPSINGDSIAPGPLELRVGKTYRFRFVNITPASAPTFAIREDSVPVTWSPRAKDGADLPELQRLKGPALRRIFVGETFDADWTPSKAGVYALTAGSQSRWFYNRKVIVR